MRAAEEGGQSGGSVNPGGTPGLPKTPSLGTRGSLYHCNPRVRGVFSAKTPNSERNVPGGTFYMAVSQRHCTGTGMPTDANRPMLTCLRCAKFTSKCHALTSARAATCRACAFCLRLGPHRPEFEPPQRPRRFLPAPLAVARDTSFRPGVWEAVSWMQGEGAVGAVARHGGLGRPRPACEALNALAEFPVECRRFCALSPDTHVPAPSRTDAVKSFSCERVSHANK